VLAIIGACTWGGNRIFSWIGDQWTSATSGIPGFDNNGEEPARTDGLTRGTEISLDTGGDTAAIAGNGRVYTAVVTTGSTQVTAYDTTGGQAWRSSIQMEPKEVHLRLVGDLLLVDGESDVSRGEKDTRAVIGVGDGQVKWTAPWITRIDLMYLGTDVVTETLRPDKEQKLERVDLLTGQSRWARPTKGGFSPRGDRLAMPSLVWPGDKPPGTIVPTYEITFQNRRPFQESLQADAGVAVAMQDEGKAGLIDLGSGAVKSTGAVNSEGDLPWHVFDGLAIFLKKGTDGTLVAYRLSDWKQAWEFKTTAGTKVEDFRPCGPKVICVVGDASRKSLIGVGTDNGQAKWTKPFPDLGDDPNWYVLDNKLVLGEGTFDSVTDPKVTDPSNGNEQLTLGQGLNQKIAYAGGDGKLAMVSVKVSTFGSTKWQVSVVSLADGKVIGAAEYGDNILQQVSITANTVVLLDKDNRKVYRFGIPGPK